MGPQVRPPWTKEEFEQQLRAKGTRYHIHHPFHIAMNSGLCTKAQVQGWVYNRFYYQIRIPVKDAAILANMSGRDERRQWILRIIDHDGTQGDEGGIEAWLRLGDACGLKREDVQSLKHVLPGVRFAVDAYVNFARRAPWQEAVCSSLTELFAPEIHKKRLENWRPGARARDPAIQARRVVDDARYYTASLRRRPRGGRRRGGTGRQEGGREAAY